MNYWHIQLHPDDRNGFNVEVIKKILSEKKVIGLGDWEEGKSQIDQFYNTMKIGDVVAIKNGATPIALVKIIGQAYVEKNVDEDFDWFPHRRKIEILGFYNQNDNFSIPQPRGTLSICNDLNTATSLVIINWYKKIMLNKLMENIKLTPERKKQINTLWKKFRNEIPANEIDYIKQQIEELSSKWLIYRTKIIDGSFSLDDYTNTLGNETATMPGGYLCNFLERTTKTVFGSSKPGNALNFGVKLNNDSTTYSIGIKNSNASRQEAIAFFDENIKPVITSIVKESSIIEKIGLVEKASYGATQILRKLAVLDNLTDFIYIYSDSAINSIYEEFIDASENLNLGKNHNICLVSKNILSLPANDEVEVVLLSKFLWMYANAVAIADINTPNVILYGPPGTGKTYAVRNNLNFVCQGDRNRYEILQFHPSFTYEDFIEGIKPKGVSTDGNIKFELVNGVFKRFCMKAKNDPDNDYYFVVDEINRANLSSVFGETLSTLEKDYRHNVNATNSSSNLIKTQYSTLIEDMIKDDPANESLAYHFENGNATFGVPSNVFFIGMMNDVDKSIDAFDLALRRRFKWIRKDCDYEVVEEETKYRDKEEFTNVSNYKKACEKLNNYISNDLGLGKSYEFGHSFFMKMSDIAKRKDITSTNMEMLFNLHLRPTLKEYLRAVFAENELDSKLNEALDKFRESIK